MYSPSQQSFQLSRSLVRIGSAFTNLAPCGIFAHGFMLLSETVVLARPNYESHRVCCYESEDISAQLFGTASFRDVVLRSTNKFQVRKTRMNFVFQET